MYFFKSCNKQAIVSLAWIFGNGEFWISLKMSQNQIENYKMMSQVLCQYLCFYKSRGALWDTGTMCVLDYDKAAAAGVEYVKEWSVTHWSAFLYAEVTGHVLLKRICINLEWRWNVDACTCVDQSHKNVHTQKNLQISELFMLLTKGSIELPSDKLSVIFLFGQTIRWIQVK